MACLIPLKVLRHYILLGGDLNVEILAPEDPIIEQVNSSKVVCEFRV